MSDRLLGAAEVCAWIAVSFTVFLALRVASIFLDLVDPAQCTDSCGAGAQAIPIALFTFGLGWFPVLLVVFARKARRGEENWWVPHAVVVTIAHATAMVLVAQIFGRFADADSRTGILAFSAAAFDVITLALLLPALARKRRNL